MDINDKLEELGKDGSQNAMLELHKIINQYPLCIPRGLEILSQNDTNLSVSIISTVVDKHSQYVPAGLNALSTCASDNAAMEIFKLARDHLSPIHTIQAIDIYENRGEDMDVVMLSELLTLNPDFIDDGLEAFGNINSDKSLKAVASIAIHYPEHQTQGLRILKESSHENAPEIYNKTLDKITKETAKDKVSTGANTKPQALLPAASGAFDYNLSPAARLQALAADGSDKAVNEIYKLVTNHEELISEGIALLAENNGYRAVASIRLLCEAHPEYVSEGIAALGRNPKHTAPRTMADLLKTFPDPENVTQAFSVLSQRGDSPGIVGIGRIMMEHPDQAEEGFNALRPHMNGKEAEKVMVVAYGVMEKQPAAIGPGLVFLQEEGSDESLDLIDYYLEQMTGRPLTDESRERAEYEKFCDGLDEYLETLEIDRPEDGEDYPSL